MTALAWELPPVPATVDWPDFLPDHLSASQLGLLERCPESYRQRYVLGKKTRPGAALIWGRADHAAHEQNFVQKVTTGEDISTADVQSAFAEAFDVESQSDVEWGEDKPSDFKDAGARLVAVYHRQVSPGLQPLAVEQEFSLDIPGVAVPVIGRVDLRLSDHTRERKTAKSKPSGVARHRIQGMLYEAALSLPVEWDYSVKTKTPAVYTSAEIPALRMEGMGTLAERYVLSMANHLTSLASEFGPDREWPGALTDDWACNYCGFRPECAWWGNS